MSTVPTSEILMFQVGSRIYAAEVYDVLRIGGAREAGLDPVTETCLGRPFTVGRGLVVAGEAGEAALAVDHVLGVRTVPGDDVQPLPAFAAHCINSAAVVGLVFVDDSPTLLIDIPTLIREQRSAAPAPESRIPDA